MERPILSSSSLEGQVPSGSLKGSINYCCDGFPVLLWIWRSEINLACSNYSRPFLLSLLNWFAAISSFFFCSLLMLTCPTQASKYLLYLIPSLFMPLTIEDQLVTLMINILFLMSLQLLLTWIASLKVDDLRKRLLLIVGANNIVRIKLADSYYATTYHIICNLRGKELKGVGTYNFISSSTSKHILGHCRGLGHLRRHLKNPYLTDELIIPVRCFYFISMVTEKLTNDKGCVLYFFILFLDSNSVSANSHVLDMVLGISWLQLMFDMDWRPLHRVTNVKGVRKCQPLQKQWSLQCIGHRN